MLGDPCKHKDVMLRERHLSLKVITPENIYQTQI